MQRRTTTYLLTGTEVDEMKQRMLHWASQFSILLFLDSNSYPSRYGRYECLVAAGAANITSGVITDLAGLQEDHIARPDWRFGHISYDYKNVAESKLTSTHPVKTGFPLMGFFIPQTVCHINAAKTVFTISSYDDPEQVYQAILATGYSAAGTLPAPQFIRKTDKNAYLNTIAKLRQHIGNGDCYEINYCNEAFAENIDADPLTVFKALNTLSPAPFAAYYRTGDQYMMCASPERYIRKESNRILSQPIKGTARRGATQGQDEQIKKELRGSIKEQAENVMITDLVRNDLARCCETGSVVVEELFGIYTFPQVHQMISTVSGTLRQGLGFADALKCSFPMGSMTGAPKYKVMELIDLYECSRRELFSGSVGYITPDGDFDFNVVIRSLFYNTATKYLSYQTGGAITYDSEAEQEWEEMLLKAWALERIFMVNG